MNATTRYVGTPPAMAGRRSVTEPGHDTIASGATRPVRRRKPAPVRRRGECDWCRTYRDCDWRNGLRLAAAAADEAVRLKEPRWLGEPLDACSLFQATAWRRA